MWLTLMLSTASGDANSRSISFGEPRRELDLRRRGWWFRATSAHVHHRAILTGPRHAAGTAWESRVAQRGLVASR
jgi:hypothetical protein